MEQNLEADISAQVIETAARSSIDLMQKIADMAEEASKPAPTANSGQFASGNSFNNPNQVNEYSRVRRDTHEMWMRLTKEPLLARVDYLDEDGTPSEIFVAAVGAPPGLGAVRVASLNSPLGSIASKKTGTEFTLRTGNMEQEVLITAVTKLYPEKKFELWDSVNTRIDILDHGIKTITSLRDYLEWLKTRGYQPDEIEDILSKLEADEAEATIVLQGSLRAQVDGRTLRQQRIVDEYQDEIFRMPIDRRLFLSGPPGTGKTTTLIRRLGQKVDLNADVLDAAERAAIERAGDIFEHPRSWMMFSPTELLKQYVKESFAREGVPASEDNIKTWTHYRREIARDYLSLLNTTNRRGLFVMSDERPAYLAPQCGSSEDAGWYDAFIAYFWQSISEDLAGEADALARSQDRSVAEVGGRIQKLLASQRQSLDSRIIGLLARERDNLRQLVKNLQGAFERVSTLLLNRILNGDRLFLDAFGKFANELRRTSDDDAEDEDAEAIFDEDDEEQDQGQLSTLGVRAARSRYEKLIRALANARANGKRLGAKSNSSKLVEWLTPERLPDDEQMRQLAQIARAQRRLRKFLHLDRLIMRAIISKFRAFRTHTAVSDTWYLEAPLSSNEAGWQEIDLLILATLRIGAEVSGNLERVPDLSIPNRGILADIRALYRNQILVDEVTDFSLIQLAIMHELANPALHSFFVCGDFNQRLTEWGITSDHDFDWISTNFVRRSVSISYRQTRKLVNLASAITGLDHSSQDVSLPDFIDIDGVPAVWCENLSTDALKAKWLRDRIGEIEFGKNGLPSIAVLVNTENQVEPLAAELNKVLKDINYQAEACKDGKSIGSANTIRVFDIQHIKGLEFQAAFFMDMDDLINMKPSLFSKYLYVGATRAATYFGVTFKQSIPSQIYSLEPHFEQTWR